eukprot:6184583-Prymnesium_polylepis.1
MPVLPSDTVETRQRSPPPLPHRRSRRTSSLRSLPATTANTTRTTRTSECAAKCRCWRWRKMKARKVMERARVWRRRRRAMWRKKVARTRPSATPRTRGAS